MKIYHVEYMDYESSYIVASYYEKEQAEAHAASNPENLQVIEGDLLTNFDDYKKLE